MDILITEPLVDVDHLVVVIIMTNIVHTTVVADVLNQPLFVVDIPNTDLCIQVVEVLQVEDVKQ